MRRRHLKVFAAAVALTGVLACAGASAQAQGYPARPVTMIVPFPAGGGSDILARIVADGMRQRSASR